ALSNDGIHGMQEVESAPQILTAGYHDLRLEYFEQFGAAGVILRYRPLNGPKQVIPTSVLLPPEAPTGISDVGALASQADLRVLSLEHSRIADVRPLTKLDPLKVLRLDSNTVA